MDKKIERKTKKWPKYIGALVLVIVVAVFSRLVFSSADGQTLKIDRKQLVINTVFAGKYDDYFRIRGTVEPLETLFLDAVDGGRVEAIHVEDGELVGKGQLLVELSNPTVQLNVIRTQAETSQQLNNLSELELLMEQNRLAHKASLIDIEYNIGLRESQLKRQNELFKKGAIQKSEIEELEMSYQWYLHRREVTLESQKSDEIIQKQQMAQLSKASRQLLDNLNVAKKSIDRLVVNAPIRGRITAFSLKVGESVAAGVRIGQIDSPEDTKLTANIDEFYINRVQKGQLVEVDANGKPFKLKVSKIYPQVTNNQFKIDMVFDGETPSDIRRGQTLQGQLQLADPEPAVLIGNGSFYQTSGGNWVFVVSADGSEAVKRPVKLGRRNTQFVEVIDGLNAGEKVITSSYVDYKDVQRLKLIN